MLVNKTATQRVLRRTILSFKLVIENKEVFYNAAQGYILIVMRRRHGAGMPMPSDASTWQISVTIRFTYIDNHNSRLVIIFE